MSAKSEPQSQKTPRIPQAAPRRDVNTATFSVDFRGIGRPDYSPRYINPNRHYHTKPTDYERYERQLLAQQTRSTAELVGQYLEAKRCKGLAEHSMKLYSSLLGRFAAVCPELPAEPEPIERFLEQYSCANTTRRGYYRILKRFYRFMAKRVPIFNPMDLVELPKAPRKIIESLDPGELGSLLTTSLSPRDRAAILVMSGCGLRQGEARALTPGDIYADRIKVKGKTGERLVPASSDIVAALLAIGDGRRDSEPIFWGSYGRQPLGSAGFERLTQKAFELAGITGKRASPHILRHTFARICIVNGMDISTLRVLLGHSSIATTEKYLCFATREIDDKYARCAPLSHLAGDRLPLPDGRLSLAPTNDIRSSKLSNERISLWYEGVNDYVAELAKTFSRAAELLSGLAEVLARHDGHQPEQLEAIREYLKHQVNK